MNILLISECNKKALVETRRIVDQFAERKGERTWQTAITLEGLDTLRKLLRKSARRNTAVACHWIKSANQSELLWIVGNLRRFNSEGTVPTNTTGRNILKSDDENSWHTAEAMGLLAAIAGLFHDFGKANMLFQKKLLAQAFTDEPYRHEWVSLRLFQAFVGTQDDQTWLTRLSHITADDEEPMLASLQQDPLPTPNNPFATLTGVAKVVAWLIVSHHRLPVYPSEGSHAPQLTQMSDWMIHQLTANWNSPQCDRQDRPASQQRDVWCFPYGTPMRSATWQKKAQRIARRALHLPSLLDTDWLRQSFTAHMARLVLMLADHHYSSLPAQSAWQDASYQAYANTDRQTRSLKQRLDEHNIGVGHNAILLARCLPALRQTLPAITRHKTFKQREAKAAFRWQNSAYDLASTLRETSQQQGFFGINMASTGCGKTFANARIMYALADEKRGCRFSVALGLRTLTLQTGDALRQRLRLADDDLAVLIGSQAVKELHELSSDPQKETKTSAYGSESAEALFAEHQYVRYEGSLDDGRLSEWLKQSPTLHRLLSAPVLVSTIDHLIPATEGTRGGKQIAPMLRLLTSDLVLDEPDDFDLDDLPALCRLVNWAGMLGSRVLLSSATLPPALVQALFQAYLAGRKQYQSACGQPDRPLATCCAWFDEYDARQQLIGEGSEFRAQHAAFVAARIKKLNILQPLRCADLVNLSADSRKPAAVQLAMAQVMHHSVLRLHEAHHQTHTSGKTVSVGVIRMANITPLVAVARCLLEMASPENYRIHYCVYHSQHPLAIRSHLEQRLDATLDRHDESALWQVAEIRQALEHDPEQHHLFVILATSVAEVGRDHDYDWGIAEPSSMRSLIQLAGRIQRHRQQVPQSPNLLILNQNYKSLIQSGETPAYCHPGFEAKDYLLKSHEISDILQSDQYQIINALPRINERDQAGNTSPFANLVDLEHYRLWAELLGLKSKPESYSAALWWRQGADAFWCGELQRRKPFRRSAPDEQYCLWIEEEGEPPVFMVPDSGDSGFKQSGSFESLSLTYAQGVSAWIDLEPEAIYLQLAEVRTMELKAVSEKFGEIRLRKREGGQVWFYHPLLGVFREGV